MVLYQDSSPDEPDIVWTRYGLKESPYSTSPMRLLGRFSFKNVFSGRQEETKRLKRIITSSSSSRNLVLGNFGVGKTTFANYVRWLLAIKPGPDSKYLTTSTEIKIQPDWDATRFLLSTLSAIYTSSIIFNWKGFGIKLKSVDRLKDYVSISKQRSYQGSIAGFGGGYGTSNTPPPLVSPEILEELLTSICKELSEKGKQIIILYNNLENIERGRLSEIFKSIRDYIQIEGLHVIFSGPSPILSALEAHLEVHSVFSQPLMLTSLNEENVLEILKKRCDSLTFEQKGRYIPPYDETTVKTLYRMLNRNLRFTFKILEDVTIDSEDSAPCKITMEEIKIKQEREKQEVLSNLPETHLKIVGALLDKQKLMQKELSKITGIGATNLTTPVRELVDKGLIVAERGKDKRVKYIGLSENSYLRFFFTLEKQAELV